MTTATLRTAVTAWCNDSASAEAAYGHISNWDTSGVNDTSYLFGGVQCSYGGYCYTYTYGSSCYENSYSNPSVCPSEAPSTDDDEFYSDYTYDYGSTTRTSWNWNGYVGAYCSTFRTFNDTISSWDLSQVKDMKYMFYYASSFDKDLSQWDTSQVEDM